MANVSSRKGSGSLFFIGTCFQIFANLLMLTLAAGMLLILFALFSVFHSGWQSTWGIFESALSGMTSTCWATHVSNPLIISLLLIAQLIVERCRVFAIGCFLIFAFALVGFIDGLVQRDIRKFQNARESTFLFHRSKNLLFALFYTGYFLFLLIPMAFSLSAYIMAMAICIGIFIKTTTKYFKKYL